MIRNRSAGLNGEAGVIKARTAQDALSTLTVEGDIIRPIENRELRMIELKEEINTLYRRLGQKGPYQLPDPTGAAEPDEPLHRQPESLERERNA